MNFSRSITVSAEALRPLVADVERSRDSSTIHDALRDLFEACDRGPSPYAPPIAASTAEGADAAGILADASTLLTLARAVEFERAVGEGFDGPRIAAAGDSWVHCPGPLPDLCTLLTEKDEAVVVSAGRRGGDEAGDRPDFDALSPFDPDVFLVSMGGDRLLCGGDVPRLLEAIGFRAQAAGKARAPGAGEHARKVASEVLGEIAAAGLPAPVIVHGYAPPIPRADHWLGRAFADCDLPREEARVLLQAVFGAYAAALAGGAKDHEGITAVDVRTADRGTRSFADELRPRRSGYRRAAGLILRTARALKGSPGPKVARPVAPAAQDTDPETAATETEGRTVKAIVLDPGHGGDANVGGSSFNNAVGPEGTLEKTVTLETAMRARDLLVRRGYAVELTREGDVNLGLADRARVARNIGAAAFVSIHYNAFNGAVQGTETFVHSDGTEASADLCRALQAKVVAATGHRDRNAIAPGGVKRDGFGVINPRHHAPETAAVLLEVSFLDVAAEERRLRDGRYLDEIAAAIADGIEAHVGAPVMTESVMAEEIGDAIERRAIEAGQSVKALFEVAAVEDEAVRVERGGHALAEEARGDGGGGGGSSDLVSKLLEGIERLDEDEKRNDADEFRRVPIGPAPFVSRMEVHREMTEIAQSTRVADDFDPDDFNDFIESLRLRHFRPTEFLFPGNSHISGSCRGLNGFPPRHLWPNIENTALMIDEIRARLGAAVRILSGYRSEDYNACVGGAENSLHRTFNALDWVCDAGSVEEWRDAAHAVRASRPGFRGGIGFYQRAGTSGDFIHIDTRGTNRDWEDLD